MTTTTPTDILIGFGLKTKTAIYFIQMKEEKT